MQLNQSIPNYEIFTDKTWEDNHRYIALDVNKQLNTDNHCYMYDTNKKSSTLLIIKKYLDLVINYLFPLYLLFQHQQTVLERPNGDLGMIFSSLRSRGPLLQHPQDCYHRLLQGFFLLMLYLEYRSVNFIMR